MDCRNFRERLSEFLDRQLAAPELSQAETHMSGCPGCRGEFEELKGISQMVAGVGRKPLPVGFMQRLERRRQAQEAPAPAASYSFLAPGLPRVAAFALSGIIVVFVVMDKAKTILQPETAGMISGASSNLAAGNRAPQPHAAAPASNANLSFLRAGEAGGDSMDALKKSTDEEAFQRRAEVAASKDEKAPDGSVTSTGQKLAKAKGQPLDDSAEAFGKFGGGAGLSRAVARRKSAPRAAATQNAAASEPEQRQFTNEELIAGIEAQKAKMRIIPPGTRDERLQEAMLSAMRGSAGGGGEVQLLRPEASPASLGPGQTPAIIGKAAAGRGSAMPDLERADKNARLDEAPGVLIGSEAARQDLWHKYQMTQTPPKVDYATQLLAVVFATSAGTAIAISRVTPSEDRITIYFHELPLPKEGGAVPAAAYQFRVIPRTEKPVVFEKLP